MVQSYGSLPDVPLAVKAEARNQSVQLLNQVLADSMVLFTLYKKHHWLMRGHTFSQLHLLLDRHAEEQLSLIDLLAERVQTLGAIAISDPWHVAEVSKIPRPPRGAEEVSEMLARMVEAHAVVIGEVSSAVQTTASNLDWATNDLLVGDVLRSNEKQVWTLNEHVMDAPVIWASGSHPSGRAGV